MLQQVCEEAGCSWSELVTSVNLVVASKCGKVKDPHFIAIKYARTLEGMMLEHKVNTALCTWIKKSTGTRMETVYEVWAASGSHEPRVIIEVRWGEVLWKQCM
jgi:hypothetical protein